MNRVGGSLSKACFYIAALAIVGCLVVGTLHVVRARAARADCDQHIHSVWMEWHRQVANELPRTQQECWMASAQENPDRLLRGCVIESAADENER